MTDLKKIPVHPKDYTDCWSDDERMNFLFSAFPSNPSDNPHHWNTKMKYWVDLIQKMSEAVPFAYISWDNLFSNLSRNGKEPLGLNTVFTDLVSNGELVTLDQYRQDITSDETWMGWGVKWCVKKPANWVVGRVMSPVKNNPRHLMKSSKFISMSSLEKKCQLLHSMVGEYVSMQKSPSYYGLNIIPCNQLHEIVSDILSDEESVNIVLETLRSKKLIEIWPHPSVSSSPVSNDSLCRAKYVKFSHSYHDKAATFSEADIGIIRLCESKSILEHQIDECCAEISKSVEKAKAHLRNKQRNLALNALRKKKRLQNTVLSKEKTLSNQEELLDRLNQCKTDKMILETYKSAVAAYKNLSGGLTTDEVHKAMDDVSSILDNQSDITEALAESVGDQTDRRELEQELEELITIDASADVAGLCTNLGRIELTDRLPDVPSDFPELPRVPVNTNAFETPQALK